MRFGGLSLSLAIALSFFGAAQAQGQETIGSFSYAQMREAGTDLDRSSIATFGYNYEGALIWQCEPDGLHVKLLLHQHPGGTAIQEVFVDYRLGAQDEPAAAWRFDAPNLLAHMPVEEVAAFTQRARSASGIVLRVRSNAEGPPGVTYDLTLDQLGPALTRLSCAN